MTDNYSKTLLTVIAASLAILAVSSVLPLAIKASLGISCGTRNIPCYTALDNFDLWDVRATVSIDKPVIIEGPAPSDYILDKPTFDRPVQIEINN